MAKSSNKSVVPEAREVLNRFKMEAANEVGVQSPLEENIHILWQHNQYNASKAAFESQRQLFLKGNFYEISEETVIYFRLQQVLHQSEVFILD